MSVVINEFEVVPQAPATAQQEAATAQKPPEAPPPEFERELERVLRRMKLRAERVEAD
jgi:hypothetical protein